MENLRESSGGKPPKAPSDADRPTAPANGDGSSIREELRARRAKASRRIGEEWERVSENAKDYAHDHAIRVALGSLVLGVALGAIVGSLVGRE